MKKILIPLIFVLAVVFALSVNNSFKVIKPYSGKRISLITNIHTLNYTLSANKPYNDLQKRISAKIDSLNKKISQLSIWMVIINLLVTVITGLSTLMATISTIKNNVVTKKIAIAIAIITFASFLLTFGSGQLGTFKESSEYKREQVQNIRKELELLKPDQVSSQISSLNSKLDEIL
jgi:hypothetical protein